jgi:hypothetical protein
MVTHRWISFFCAIFMLAILLALAVLASAHAVTFPRTLPATILAGYPGSLGGPFVKIAVVNNRLSRTGNGYNSQGQPYEAVLTAARSGVNVVIWNDIVLGSNPQTGLIDCFPIFLVT